MSYKNTQALLERTAASGDYQQLAQSFRRSLLAENKAPRTVQTYTESLNRFVAFLAGRGMPTDPTLVSREHVEAFVADLLARHKPATAANRYRALQTFFRWLVEEGEIAASPMAKMRPPAIPEAPPPVLPADQLARLLRACEGARSRIAVTRRSSACWWTPGCGLTSAPNSRWRTLTLSRTSPA